VHFSGTDHLERDADGIGRTAVLLVLVHAVTVGRQPEVAGDVKAHVLAGLGGQALVEIDRVFVELSDGVTHVEQGQQTGRVPGRTRGQLGTLQQYDVRPTLQGEVIQRADADHAAADDDHTGMSFHPILPTRMRQAV